MLKGIRIGLDVGSVRIGVSKCDLDGILATPVTTISAGAQAIDEVVALAKEFDAIVIYVGKPLGLKGNNTHSTKEAMEFAALLAQQLQSHPVSVRLIDERLSTVTAQRGMHEAGRNVKQSRDAIDQGAAVVILDHALETERHSGQFAGEVVAQ